MGVPVRLVSIVAEIHVHGDVRYWQQPLRLGLGFTGRDFLRIREQRGDSIGFDSLPLESADLGEGGRIEIHDVTDRLDPTLRGAPIDTLSAIEAEGDRLLGLAIHRLGDAPFCIWIDDDEFHWGGEPALAAAMARRGLKVRRTREI